MPGERNVKKMFKNKPEGKTPVGKPTKTWLEDAENYLKEMGDRGWRKQLRIETPGN